MSEAEIFKALADPTRRAVFERLADGVKNASELREGLAISQPAMSQHLAVLREAGLVAEERQGRFVHYSVDPAGLAQIYRWLQRYRIFWPERVEALKQLLKEMDQ
jgi:DNA-binding transcriptional ArsR family regulator